LDSALDYTKLRFFSKLIRDYLQQGVATRPLYGEYPSIAAFEKQLETRQDSFVNRELLVQVLQEQYKTLENSEKSIQNITALAETNTFTVTTGHQLNLFTGPLYFIYKIVSTINLAKQLKIAYPSYHFVPVYWMATEDHDFEEINHFTYKNTKLTWKHESGAAVGTFDLSGVETVKSQFESLLGSSENETVLKELFKKVYLSHNNLASATQFLVHELFGQYGLVQLDANVTSLKKHFSQHLLADLKEQVCYQEVSKTVTYLKEHGYKAQVNPREINLFYVVKNTRKRIRLKNSLYEVVDSAIRFTVSEIEQELQDYPERFSPNVLLRPLYQEFILPNLAYIGGGGELAYWLQLKSFFEKSQVSFPILMLRNSALWLTKRQEQKLNKLGMSATDLFLTPDALTKKFLQQTSHPRIDFAPFETKLRDLYTRIENIASCTDVTFEAATKAQAQKQVNALYKLEKRLLRAQKKKKSEEIARLLLIQNEIFPKGGLQERSVNFSSLYVYHGTDFLKILEDKLEPFQSAFTIFKDS